MGLFSALLATERCDEIRSRHPNSSENRHRAHPKIGAPRTGATHFERLVDFASFRTPCRHPRTRAENCRVLQKSRSRLVEDQNFEAIWRWPRFLRPLKKSATQCWRSRLLVPERSTASPGRGHLFKAACILYVNAPDSGPQRGRAGGKRNRGMAQNEP